MHRRWTAHLAAGAAGAVALLSVTAPARAADSSVAISGFAFAPSAVTIGVGDTVTWRNSDDAPHSVTAEGGAFDSSPGCAPESSESCLTNGEQYSRAFDQPGTFAYFCVIHTNMRGTVVVRAAAPPSTSPPTTRPTTTTRPPTTTRPSPPPTIAPAPNAPRPTTTTAALAPTSSTTALDGASTTTTTTVGTSTIDRSTTTSRPRAASTTRPDDSEQAVEEIADGDDGGGGLTIVLIFGVAAILGGIALVVAKLRQNANHSR